MESERQDLQTVQCPICRFHFPGPDHLSKHFNSKHSAAGLKASQVIYGEMVSCRLCSKKIHQPDFVEHLVCQHYPYMRRDPAASVESNMFEVYLMYFTHHKTSFEKLKSNAHGKATTKLQQKPELPDHSLSEQHLGAPAMRLSVSDQTLVQSVACSKLPRSLPHCHMCLRNRKRDSGSSSGDVCQFEGFRKIKSDPCSGIKACGFLDPDTDPSSADEALWSFETEHPPPKPSPDEAKFILQMCGYEFCRLVMDEQSVMSRFRGQKVIWKRLQAQVREMCDVCSTSIFNVHFTCPDCGILVCIDCRRSRAAAQSHDWPACQNAERHSPDHLLLTTIICKDWLKRLNEELHLLKKRKVVDFQCSCGPVPESSPVACTLTQQQIEANLAEAEAVISRLDQCPLCHKSKKVLWFDSRYNVRMRSMHLIEKHFRADLEEEASKPSRLICAQCAHLVPGDRLGLLLHIGIDHGLLSPLVKMIDQTKQSNIVLRVDLEKTCAVCGMIYSKHMMTPTEIRIHLLSHYASQIKSMMPDFLVPSSDNLIWCVCGYKSRRLSQFIRSHLAVWHRLLDVCCFRLPSPLIPATVRRRSSDLLGPCSAADSVVQCILCGEKLTPDSIVPHCTQHAWIKLKQMITMMGHRCLSDCGTQVDYRSQFAAFHQHLTQKHCQELIQQLWQPLAIKQSLKSLETEIKAQMVSVLKGIWCPVCEKSMADFAEMVCHYPNHFRDDPMLSSVKAAKGSLSECTKCNVSFVDVHHLRFHIVIHHLHRNVRFDTPAGIRLFKRHCDLRAQRSSPRSSSLMRDRSREPPTNKSFATRANGKAFLSKQARIVFKQPYKKPRLDRQATHEAFRDMLSSILQEDQKMDLSVMPKIPNYDLPSGQPIQSYDDDKVCATFIRTQTQVDSSKTYPHVPHDWLCHGKLLLLMDWQRPGASQLFCNQWRRGQPVIIANSMRHLEPGLWHPKAFLNDFGHLRHDLINTLSGKILPGAPLWAFWQGFECLRRRLKDVNGRRMLLKLKDWPPCADIADYMPKRFANLFQNFPMPVYTRRDGVFNLASFLPSHYLRPELGPKLYIAYGSAAYPQSGTTNLHIDMSDAVNCMVFACSASDSDQTQDYIEVLKAIDEAGCDIEMRRRARQSDQVPAALWHIFSPSDSPKIRDFLIKIAMEKGKFFKPLEDPIHDQSIYLDSHLLARLYEEYGVQGYAIVQCAGDTVFIPAGAAHQVRNLYSCIKVAEDFVSPQNMSQFLHLTQEFRHLTDRHTNHEDKLQIKSILYHTIKNAVAALLHQQAVPGYRTFSQPADCPPDQH